VGLSNKKLDAIYDLREAAEKKAIAEKQLEEKPTPELRDQLLGAKADLERKTVVAIEVCHDCGHQHESGAACSPYPKDNVTKIDDRRDA